MFEIHKTWHFDEWFSRQDAHTRSLIIGRIKHVKESGTLINAKYLGAKLFEFKWSIGIRVYFTISGNKLVLLLNGGRKDGQEKDIQKARAILRNFTLRPR